MNFELALSVFTSVICVLNFLILFFVSAFLVRFRADIVQFISTTTTTDTAQPSTAPERTADKTWDQKYEDELEFISNRIRQNSDGGV